MVTVLSELHPIAQKHYQCQACRTIIEYMHEDDFTPDELEAWNRAKANSFRIIPGQRYLQQNNTDGGPPYTWRAIPEIYDICAKYELFDD